MTDQIVQDAMCTTRTSSPTINITNRITFPILEEMLNDLDKREIVSLIFLMVDDATDFSKAIEAIKGNPATAFPKLISKNTWPDKILESLLIIGNKEVIKKMGFKDNEINDKESELSTRVHNISSYVNRAVKSLYFLCENLDNNEARRLIDDVNKKLCKPLKIYPDNMYLELYILEWLQQKYISIDQDKMDLSNLLKNLKYINCLLDLPFNFDDWELSGQVLNRNEQDSQMCSQIPDNKNSLQYRSISNDSDIKWSSPDHQKLLIIINQIDFTNTEKFKSREKGSIEDEINLERTFNDCGFKIVKHRNLNQKSMMELLESLNSKLYCRYGAIFICIMSHGFKGEVVFADDNSIAIDTIKEKFCCQKLQNVFKFLILQSCQGEKIGLLEKPYYKLVKDGPSNSINPRYRMHFCLFQATVHDFAAIRDEKQGSWFIQDLCQQIKEAKEIEISDLIKKVKLAVTKRRGSLPGHHFVDAVQVPELSGDTTTEPYVLIKVTKI